MHTYDCVRGFFFVLVRHNNPYSHSMMHAGSTEVAPHYLIAPISTVVLVLLIVYIYQHRVATTRYSCIQQ